MSENYTKVQQAFRVLHPLLAGYICQEMRREYQDNWWQEVLMTLSDQVRDLPICASGNCPSTTAPGPKS